MALKIAASVSVSTERSQLITICLLHNNMDLYFSL